MNGQLALSEGGSARGPHIGREHLSPSPLAERKPSETPVVDTGGPVAENSEKEKLSGSRHRARVSEKRTKAERDREAIERMLRRRYPDADKLIFSRSSTTGLYIVAVFRTWTAEEADREGRYGRQFEIDPEDVRCA